jgi:NAD(P)H-nitrite reductase large subunit
VRGIRWRTRRGEPRSLDCDAVGMGFGLRPETQLADLAGCPFRFDALNRCWLPERDAAGRSSARNVYLAGDGAGIAGADAAELAGRRAALALIEDIGIVTHRSAQPDATKLERELARIAVFRAGIEHAFAPPVNAAQHWPDDMTVCRCEDVTAGTMRACIRSGLATEVNRLKSLTRIGMGRCQGRMCGESAIALLAAETGKPLADVGRLRSQAPIKPIPITPMLYDDGVHVQPEEAHDE